MTFIHWTLWRKAQKVIDLLPLATHFYFIGVGGAHSTTDKNWISTDKIPASPGNYVDYKLLGHTAVAAVAAYNSSGQVISYVNGPEDNKLIEGVFTMPEGTTQMTITGGSSTWNPGLTIQQYAYLHKS